LSEHTGGENTRMGRATSEWGAAEALRLFRSKSKRCLDKEKVAKIAARRAPGIEAASSALRSLALVDSDNFLLKAIPNKVRVLIENEPPSQDTALVERVHKWLQAAPYELTRCSTGEAALSAAAHVALPQFQRQAESADEEMEKVCLAAIEQHVARRRTRVRAKNADRAAYSSRGSEAGNKRHRSPA